MTKNCLRTYLLVLMSGLLISACSQLGFLSKKESPEPAPQIPDCKKNYAKEGNFISGRVYKTWVKYENLDFKKGFDGAVAALKTDGNRLIYAERESGTINAEMLFGSQDPEIHPVELKLLKEKNSLTIHISSKSGGGTLAQETFCGFYEEFEKGIKRAHTPPQPKPVAAPPKKPPEAEKESTPPPPLPSTTAKSAPTPPSAQKMALSQTQVTWGTVNLRGGPGMNYRVVGNVDKGTSLGILEEKKGWLRVRLEDGTEAWITKAATSLAAKSPPASPPPSRPSPSPAAASEASKSKSPM